VSQASPTGPQPRARDGRRLAAVLVISSAVLVAELIGGYLANGLALLADAAHVFTDMAGIGLSLGAIWIARRPPTDRRTFGLYPSGRFRASSTSTTSTSGRSRRA
jgi:cobalt-zinc-cadmium efflux system protein